MSKMACVSSDEYKVTAPLIPAGTIAAFAFTLPSEFSVDTEGCVSPAGQIERYPRRPGGTTVMFREYAAALAGMPQELAGTGKSRDTPHLRIGPPKTLPPNRVSAIRQGATGTKASPTICLTENTADPATVSVADSPAAAETAY